MKRAELFLLCGCFVVPACVAPQDHWADYPEGLSRKAVATASTSQSGDTSGVTGYITTPEEYERNTAWARDRAAGKQVDMSLPAYTPPAQVIVTTGGLSQSYETLGEVRADTTDILMSTSSLRDAFFRSRLSVAVQGESPKLTNTQMDERLKQAARAQYGNKASAIINVSYRCEHDGDVFASGLAVHFVEPPSQPTQAAQPQKTLEEKLRESKAAREQNLITPEEYYEKRGELLKGL